LTRLCVVRRVGMFYLIGLGLGDAEDITVKGLKIVQRAERVYLEAYTSVLTVGINALEEFYGRKLILADRKMVEQQSDDMLAGADVSDIACLVVGDPFGATTHADLLLRAAEKGIHTEVVHNASIMSAVGCCGLQLYSFGETVSIVYWTEDWQPDSFYDRIVENRRRGLHTLCLLDIKVKEQSIENLMRGREIYEQPRYMSVQQAATQLLEIVARRRRSQSDDGQGQTDQSEVFAEGTLCVGLARVGSSSQVISAGRLDQLASLDLGEPLHSMIVAGRIHPLERDYLRQFAIDKSDFDKSFDKTE